ncbi:MAG: fluoride efflux transporter CrcB [Verrucomicrobia bacterium]|jgi:CrcB protein|nr:fluoride efflux transporter CrcB [Verrucomicrobiota bacterium]
MKLPTRSGAGQWAAVKLLGANLAEVAWVTVGGGLGSAFRFLLSGLVAHHLSDRLSRWSCSWLNAAFPWGTLTVNVLGSLLIGFLAALSLPEGRFLIAPGVRQFLMIGILGGFTTFSSFSLQTLELLRDGEWLMASANILLSVALCLIAVWAGFTLAALLNR